MIGNYVRSVGSIKNIYDIAEVLGRGKGNED